MSFLKKYIKIWRYARGYNMSRKRAARLIFRHILARYFGIGAPVR